MEGLLESVRQLTRELRLQMLVIDCFVPAEYQDLVEQHVQWNEEIGELVSSGAGLGVAEITPVFRRVAAAVCGLHRQQHEEVQPGQAGEVRKDVMNLSGSIHPCCCSGAETPRTWTWPPCTSATPRRGWVARPGATAALALAAPSQPGPRAPN